MEATATATATATPPQRDVTTGVAELDRLVEAVFGGDAAYLLVHARLIDIPCVRSSEPEFEHQLRCEEGEERGDLVEAFRVSGCHGLDIRPDGITGQLAAFTGREFSVYAIYRVQASDYWAGREYEAVFATRVNDAVFGVYRGHNEPEDRFARYVVVFRSAPSNAPDHAVLRLEVVARAITDVLLGCDVPAEEMRAEAAPVTVLVRPPTDP